jgi:hypothetical protein
VDRKDKLASQVRQVQSAPLERLVPLEQREHKELPDQLVQWDHRVSKV